MKDLLTVVFVGALMPSVLAQNCPGIGLPELHPVGATKGCCDYSALDAERAPFCAFLLLAICAVSGFALFALWHQYSCWLTNCLPAH